MEIKRVAPETTDYLEHVGDKGKVRARAERRVMRENKREKNNDLVFGTIPKSTLGIISLVLMFLMALLFGIKELEMSVIVYIIVLVFCTVMGLLLSSAPGFVSVTVSALLLIVGALTSLFPAVALGVAMLVSASLIIRGE